MNSRTKGWQFLHISLKCTYLLFITGYYSNIYMHLVTTESNYFLEVSPRRMFASAVQGKAFTKVSYYGLCWNWNKKMLRGKSRWWRGKTAPNFARMIHQKMQHKPPKKFFFKETELWDWFQIYLQVLDVPAIFAFCAIKWETYWGNNITVVWYWLKNYLRYSKI